MSSLKHHIAHSFSRSAHQYDQFAEVQQQAGYDLLALMAKHQVNQMVSPVIADLGCGTGFFIKQLLEDYQPQQCIGVDLAEGMLAVAADHYQSSQQVQWLCDDVESLSLNDESVDIIFANFSLQWCQNLDQLFANFSRVLKSGGYCAFTSLGNQTLFELRNAWAAVDGFDHVNRFAEAAQWQQALSAEGLDIIAHQPQDYCAYFSDVREALQSLKHIGANIVHGKHRQSLTGKKRFQHFSEAYESQRKTSGLPMSYDVHHWVLQKPHDQQ